MRTKNYYIFFLICFWPVSCFGAKEKMAEILSSAPNKSIIENWGKSPFTSIRTFEYEVDKIETFVMLVDRGSGIYLENIYVYEKYSKNEEWHLRLFYKADTKVTIEKNGKSLLFKAQSGDLMVEHRLGKIDKPLPKERL